MYGTDRTATAPPSYTTTPEEDVALRFDTTALLANADPPTVPQSALRRVVEHGTDEAVALPTAPTVAGVVIAQRVGGLAPGTYRLRVSFLTGGDRRALTLTIVCVE